MLEGATRVVRQSALTMLTTQKVLKPGVARRASVESCQKWQTLYIGLQGFCSLLDIQNIVRSGISRYRNATPITWSVIDLHIGMLPGVDRKSRACHAMSANSRLDAMPRVASTGYG